MIQKLGLPSVKVQRASLLRNEKSISVASAILISKVQPCPTSSGFYWHRWCVCVGNSGEEDSGREGRRGKGRRGKEGGGRKEGEGRRGKEGEERKEREEV